MERLVSRQTGSLQEYCSNEGNISRNVITLSILSVGPVQKGHTWSAKDSSFVCCGSHYRDYLGEESLPYLKECYSNIFDNVDRESLLAISIDMLFVNIVRRPTQKTCLFFTF